MLDLSQFSSLSSAQETLLRKQKITRDTPGPILQDIETMLDLVSEEGLRVSASQNLIYTKALPDINERLSYSLKADYARLLQKAFPTIAGLNLLLRATALVQVRKEGAHPKMRLNEPVAASWRDLNPTEQYMSLLEAWLNRADEKEIFENSRGWRGNTLVELLQFIHDIPPTGLEPDEETRDRGLKYRPGYAGLALMWLFGFVELDEHGTAAGEPWQIDRIELRPFGKILLRRLGRALYEKKQAAREENPAEFWGWDLDIGSLELTRNELQHILQSYFPEWERHLAPPPSELRPETHVFVVELYDLCRWRIAVPGATSLHALSECILSAVRFDRDHLYRFTYEDEYGHRQTVNVPYGQLEPPYSDEVRIGEVPLKPGTEMTFVYDFGDLWKFELTLEAVAPGDVEVSEPTVLEGEGTPPEQYPDPGEWG